MIVTEIAVGACVAQKGLYRFNDLMASISSGTCQQLFVALMAKFADPKATFRFVNERCKLVDFDVKGRIRLCSDSPAVQACKRIQK